MSSISITTTGIAAPRSAARPATRLRLTARGRRVLLALAALPLAAGIGFAALSGGSALATGEASGVTGASFATVTVMPGDTLWSLAEEVAPGEDPRDVIAAIQELNVIQGAGLQVGQELAIPAQYTD